MPPDVYTNFPPVSTSDSVNVVLFDAVNTQSWDQSSVYAQLVKYLSNVPQGTKLAAFNLTSRLHMLTGITTDASVLLAALTAPKSGTMPQQSLLFSSTNEMNPDDWVNGERARLAPPGPSALLEGALKSRAYGELQLSRTDVRVGLTLPGFATAGAISGGNPRAKECALVFRVVPNQHFSRRQFAGSLRCTAAL